MTQSAAGTTAQGTALTLDVAALGVGALISAGLALNGSLLAKALETQVAKDAPKALAEMRAFLEKLSPAERDEQIRLGASALALSAEAYMQTHGNKLPGNEREPSLLNTALDLAWRTHAGLGKSANTPEVSRATKVRELITYTQKVALGGSPTRTADTASTTGPKGTANAAGSTRIPGGPSTPAKGTSTPAKQSTAGKPGAVGAPAGTSNRTGGRVYQPRPSETRRGPKRARGAAAPVPVKSSGGASVRAVEKDVIEKDVNAKLGQLVNADTGQVTKLSGEIAEGLAKLRGNNYKDEAALGALEEKFADAVVRKAPAAARQARLNAFIRGAAPKAPAVVANVYEMMSKSPGELTTDEKKGLHLFFARPGTGAVSIEEMQFILNALPNNVLRSVAQASEDPGLYNWLVTRALQQNQDDELYVNDLRFVLQWSDLNQNAVKFLDRMNAVAKNKFQARTENVANTLADIAQAGYAQRVGLLLQTLNNKELEIKKPSSNASAIVKAMYRRNQILRGQDLKGYGYERIDLAHRYQLTLALGYKQSKEPRIMENGEPVVATETPDPLFQTVASDIEGKGSIGVIVKDAYGEHDLHGTKYSWLVEPWFGRLKKLL
ncbi:MAG: hypothetical protein H7Z43_00120 [Clostridia bacterium]|nr:hypothetical protein [Deltaproteobacteria bacterium]